MPQQSCFYANARISALEKGLFSAQTVRKMAEGSLEDAMRVLLDAHYGGLSDATPEDCERMIENERRHTAQVIAEVSPKPELTDLLLFQTDAHNLKMLLKGRMLGRTDVPLADGGVHSAEWLSSCVQAQDYAGLPVEMASALDALEQKLKVDAQPQLVSVAVDSGYLGYAMRAVKALSDPLMQTYFGVLCDFSNLLTFLRMRAMGAAKEDMKGFLLPEGGIKHKTLTESYDLSADSLSRALSGSQANEAIQRGLSDMLQSGNIGALEKERDNYLVSLLRAHRYENDTVYPVIGYYLARDREAKAIRLIVTAKRNGLDDAVIAERLRELYG